MANSFKAFNLAIINAMEKTPGSLSFLFVQD